MATMMSEADRDYALELDDDYVVSSRDKALLSSASTSQRHRRCSGKVIFIYVVSLFACLVCGTSYAFSAWSVSMKSALHYSTSDIELVGSMGTGSGFLGGFIGVIVLVLPPSVNCIIASTFYGVGYLGMAAPLAGIAVLSPPIIVAFNNFLCAMGSGFLYSVALAVNAFNVPQPWLGTVLSSLATCYGLSAFFFTSFYTLTFDNDCYEYLLFSASACAVISLISAVTLEQVSYATDDNVASDATLSTSASALAVNDPMSAVTLDFDKLRALDEEDAIEEDIELPKRDETSSKHDVAPSSTSITRRVLVIFSVLLRQPTFYLIFAFMFVIAGGGLVEINNVALIVQTLNDGKEDPDLTLKLIAVLSVANGTGRLLMGLSDFTRARRGVCFIFSSVVMTACHLGNLLFVNDKYRVFYGVIMSGLAYGSMWGSTPTITAEAFGRRAFAVTFGWISLSYSIAAVIFNLIVGHMYDAHLQAGTAICVGTECYRDAYILCTCTSIVGIVLAIVLYTRTKRGLKGGRLAAALAASPTANARQ